MVSNATAQDRKVYYKDWDKYTKESINELEKNDEEEKEKADESLGLNKPRSEAEKKDMDKRSALKEAKKLWDDKRIKEMAQKMDIGDGLVNEKVILDSVTLENKPVVLIKNAKDCTFTLPSNLSHQVIKIFIDSCENCKFDIHGKIVTEHYEISHCENIEFNVFTETSTVQLDLCDTTTIRYAVGVFKEGHKIFHAGVKNLKVHTSHSSDAHEFCYSKQEIQNGEILEEKQFLTHYIEGNVITEPIVRSKGNMPVTEREIAKMKQMGEAEGIQTDERAAELKKIGGNEAFAEQNYAQAAVYYTESNDMAAKDSKLKYVTYSNRAACWLKLGQPERALEDAEECIKLNPKFVKGLFRKGLALHAMKRYQEAVPVLGKASNMEPKNKQIKQAYGFAELRARQEMKKAMNR